MWIASAFCLSVVFVVCLWGSYANAYNDNLGQRLFMAIIAVGCATRINSVCDTRYVNPEWLIIHVGMCGFAVSTAWKVYAHVVKRKRAEFTSSHHMETT